MEEVRGFLFARIMQQPKSTALLSTPMVSELAEQSTRARPTENKTVLTMKSNGLSTPA